MNKQLIQRCIESRKDDPCSFHVYTSPPSREPVSVEFFQKIQQLESENAEIKRDSDRLDYLLGFVIRKPCDTADRYVFCDDENTYIGDSPRDAIDEAMKNGG